MLRRIARVAASLLLASGSLLVADRHEAAATGPYTLPFFYPYTQTQDYGCTGVTSNPWRGSPYNCYFHDGIDYGLPMGSWVASSDNGTSDAYQEWVPNGGNDQYGGGNYLFLKHGTDLYSLYYHLQYNGVIPSTIGTGISEGQKIAYSGDTGPGPAHLHYMLTTRNVIGCTWPNSCDLDPRQWTTSPGRVPWRAQYVSEASPSGYTMMQYSSVTTWVKFKNVGGRPWPRTNDTYGRNRIFLSPVTVPSSPNRDPFSERVSAFYFSGDWEYNNRVGMPDGSSSIAVNGTATFTFKLYASTQGSYTERFNMRANANFWFDYWEAGYFSGWYIPITVTHCC